MRRSASSGEKPHMPSAPSPPALLTAAARAGVVIEPIGACRIGHLRFSLSVGALLDHMPLLLRIEYSPLPIPVETEPAQLDAGSVSVDANPQLPPGEPTNPHRR